MLKSGSNLSGLLKKIFIEKIKVIAVEKFIVENWEALSFIIALVFNAGIIYRTVKDKPSETRVEEMINEKFNNHCPYSEKIQSLEYNKKETAAYREVLSKELHSENEKTHLALQRMEINLRRVCDKLELNYLG